MDISKLSHSFIACVVELSLGFNVRISRSNRDIEILTTSCVQDNAIEMIFIFLYTVVTALNFNPLLAIHCTLHCMQQRSCL
jgi:hypothetical protein